MARQAQTLIEQPHFIYRCLCDPVFEQITFLVQIIHESLFCEVARPISKTYRLVPYLAFPFCYTKSLTLGLTR